jgi:hypothetical protein
LQKDVERSLVRRTAAGRVAGDSLRSGQTDRDRRHDTICANRDQLHHSKRDRLNDTNGNEQQPTCDRMFGDS